MVACVIPEDHGVRSPVPIFFVQNLAQVSHKKPHREVVRVDLHQAEVDLAMVVQRQDHGDSRCDRGALLGVELFERIFVADFGQARIGIREDGDELVTMNKGTVGYAAPETISHDEYGIIDKQCDVWSLGVTLYVCASKKAPFGVGDSCSRDKVLEGKFRPMTGQTSPRWDMVPDALKSLIARMLVIIFPLCGHV